MCVCEQGYKAFRLLIYKIINLEILAHDFYQAFSIKLLSLFIHTLQTKTAEIKTITVLRAICSK